MNRAPTFIRLFTNSREASYCWRVMFEDESPLALHDWLKAHCLLDVVELEKPWIDFWRGQRGSDTMWHADVFTNDPNVEVVLKLVLS